MTTDIWTGAGDWSLSTNWSQHNPPNSGLNAEISGNVSLSGAGAAHSLVVDGTGSYASTDAANLSVAGFFDAAQGSSAGFSGATTISGVLWARGVVSASSSTANVTVSVGNLALAGGSLYVQGAATTSGVTATFNVAAAPAGGFAGNIEVAGLAKLAYSGTGPSVADLGADLQVDGAGASVTFNGVSALNLLSANYGEISLDGGSSLGAGGVTLASTSGFFNAGEFLIDEIAGGDAGGSSVGFAGAFTNTNSGQLDLGNSTLTTASTARVGSLLNEGDIDVQGSATGAAAATLTVEAVLYGTLVGDWTIGGDASLVYQSGGASTVQYQSALTLFGQGASVLAGETNGLSSLRSNYGSVDFEGGSALGAGGVTLALTASFTNLGYLYIDQQYLGGGSDITFDSAYVNYAETYIGNPEATAATTVSAASLTNYGSFSLVGSATDAAQTLFTVHAAAGATVAGNIDISGDAVLAYTGGLVTTVQGQSSLELDGGDAAITSAGANALTKMSANYGYLTFQGDDDSLGAGGVSLTTTIGFTNSGAFSVDTEGLSGESQIDFGGVLANYSIPYSEAAIAANAFISVGGGGGVFIGNSSLDGATTVTATSLLNEGDLVVEGNTSTSVQAKLAITGAARSSVTGLEQIEGDGEIVFGSGLVTSIQYGALLSLTGSSAQMLTNNGSASALASLVYNYGTLALEGNTYSGSGGASLTTTTNFVNDGQLGVDSYYSAYGSNVSIGGVLTNAGTVTVGNYAENGAQATNLQTKGLVNYASMFIGYGTTAATITSAGAVSDYDAIYLETGGALTVTGGAAFTQYNGEATVVSGASLSAAAVNAYGGVLDFVGALTSSDVIPLFRIGGLGDLEFDGAVDASRSVDFIAKSGLLSLHDAAAFSGLIKGFAGSDEIDLVGVSVSSLSYSGGTLTLNLSGGGVDKLKFSGSYTSASFLPLYDGGSGTILVYAPAPEDVWSGGGDWDDNSGNWSNGVPNATEYAIISAGAQITASGADSAQSLTLLSGADLTAESTSTLAIHGDLDNAGTVNFGGATASVTGTLNNTGAVYVGALTNVSVTLGGLASEGTLSIVGGAGGPQSSVTVSGAASATLSGTTLLSGDAKLTFASGSIHTVLSGATLDLTGASAQILTNNGAASALGALSGNYGVIDLENGGQLATTASFSNGGSLSIDTTSGDGGSSASFGAMSVLDDYADFYAGFDIGNTQLSHDDLVSVTSLNNEGEIRIVGDDALTPTHLAELSVATAPYPILTGAITLSGDAEIAYSATGGISSIQYGASLELDGVNAKVLAAGKSALAALASNAGILTLEGDITGLGAGGVALTTNAGFSNYGKMFFDSESETGGTAVNFQGTFLNAGQATIGNSALVSSTQVTAKALNNQGDLILQGDANGADMASLVISGATAAALVGQVQVSGDALLQFGSGAITSIQYGSSLEIDGSAARILTSNGAASALSTLSLNEGALTLQGGNLSYGVGGVSFKTTSSFTNVGSLVIDQQSGDGGSTAAFAAFTNTGSLSIGNEGLGADDLVTVTSLVNEGSVTLQGTLDNSHSATLQSSGAAAALVGQVSISGDASLAYGSGAITSIQASSSLTLFGASATVLSAGASAFSTLSTNYGTLSLHGDSSYQGLGGVSLTTNLGFTNDGSLQVDNNYQEGASNVGFSGLLHNADQIILGNLSLAAADTIRANGLTNSGSIQIQGQTGVATANLASNGAVTNTGDITIDAGGELTATASNFTQTAGNTTVDGGEIVANALAADGGLVEYQTAVSGGVSAFTIGQIGDLQFDAGVASADTITFAGATGGDLGLSDGAQFAGLIKGFGGSDIIDLLGVTSVTGLGYSGGVLTFTTNQGTDSLHFSGSYTTGSFTTMSDGAGGTLLLHT